MKNFLPEKDRVSIIIPVYNGEKYLSRILDSILSQTWKRIELILSDDGSSDGTLQLAETYKEKFRSKNYDYRIITAEHKNASAAINHALPFVTGEFLIWPDSDDFLKKDSVQKRAEFLQSHLQYQCVRSLSCYIDEKTGNPAAAQEKRGDLKNERLFFPILESGTFVCCGCYMLRTQAFFDIYPNRRIPEYDVGQNFQMLLPFMYFHPCATIEEELYTVYVRQESHSHRILSQAEEEKKYADYENMIDEIAAICKISAKEELRHINCWKQNRRYWLSKKYGRKMKACRALFYLYFCRSITLKEFIIRLLWL